ncbi:MAG: hypothetical protein VX699_09320, partial [Myxococcota bacterium]|nr:hypothetical protein [Myxococcota bacterium]
ERASQGAVQAAADGVTGRLSDEDPTQSQTDQSKYLDGLRTRMSDIVDKVVEQGEDRTTSGNLNDSPRTLLTKRELEELRVDQPELARKYEDAFHKYKDLKLSTALACLKQNRALLAEEQRADFDEQIESVQGEVTSRARLAFKDARGFGMLGYNRAIHYGKAKTATEDIDKATTELGRLEADLEKIDGEKSPEEWEKLQGEIRAKEADIMTLRGEKLELLEAVVELDNRLAAHRPLDDAHIASQEAHQKESEAANESDNKKIADLKKEAEGLNKDSDKEKLSEIETKVEKLEKDVKERDDVTEYEGILFESMANRRFPEDLDKVTPDDEPDAEGGVVVTEGLEPPKELSNDLEKRLHELEIRAKAGEKFLSEKSGTFDLAMERTIDQIFGHVDRMLDTVAGSAKGPANRFIHGSIGSAMQNAKLAGAMIQRTQAMTDRLLDTAARMRR